jgi:ribosomal protein L37AE/L43A
VTGQYHATFATLANRWQETRHANHHRCDCCGRLASVVNMGGVWACAGCLSRGQEEIAKAVMREACCVGLPLQS